MCVNFKEFFFALFVVWNRYLAADILHDVSFMPNGRSFFSAFSVYEEKHTLKLLILNCIIALNTQPTIQ
jgi:hypothetical protein